MIYCKKNAVSEYEKFGLPEDLNKPTEDSEVCLSGEYLWTRFIDWHSDDFQTEFKWSALLILKCDNIFVECEKRKVCPKPGDLIVMDIWAAHRAMPINEGEDSMIVCLYRDYKTKPTLYKALLDFNEEVV